MPTRFRCRSFAGALALPRLSGHHFAFRTTTWRDLLKKSDPPKADKPKDAKATRKIQGDAKDTKPLVVKLPDGYVPLARRQFRRRTHHALTPQPVSKTPR